MFVDHLMQYRISSWLKTAEKTRFLHLRNGHTDGRTDGPTDGPTDGQTLLQRCEDASKNDPNTEKEMLFFYALGYPSGTLTHW